LGERHKLREPFQRIHAWGNDLHEDGPLSAPDPRPLAKIILNDQAL
jgi:hypothetical protein